MVTPSQEFVSTLTTPAFVNISCSGLPDQASCIYTPESIEILPEQNAAVTSSMVLQTYAAIHYIRLRRQPDRARAPLPSPGRFCCPALWVWAVLPGERGEALAQPAFTRGAGQPGHPAGHNRMQSALLLRTPQPDSQPADSGWNVHGHSYRADEQRRYRHHPEYDVRAGGQLGSSRRLWKATCTAVLVSDRQQKEPTASSHPQVLFVVRIVRNSGDPCLPHRRQPSQRHRDLLRRILVVLQLARLIGNVRLHVKVPMAAEIE